jgi:coenzyme PQQ precursor peptide PqqA
MCDWAVSRGNIARGRCRGNLDHEKAIGACAVNFLLRRHDEITQQETIMKIWNKPQVREQAVGMEVTAYLPADIDLI